jgi:serine/threonine protein kinase
VDELLCTKICDFGLAKRKTLAELPNEAKGVSLSQHSRVMNVRSAAVQFTTLVGTPAWTAPELIANRSYTEKVDVYSFSVFLWELMCRQTPHEGKQTFRYYYFFVFVFVVSNLLSPFNRNASL